MSTQETVTWILVGALAAATAGLVAPFLLHYDQSFVHPHRFENHLPALVPQHLALQWRDLVLPFQEFAPGEFRPRFLTYLIILLELKLRLAFYQFGVLHPTFSLSWILQGLSAWLLFRIAADLLEDRVAAALAVLVYVTSTGFLSGFTMLFMPGKPLSGPLFVIVIWLMLRLDRNAQAGQLFHEAPSGVTYVLMLALFLGLLLDEVPIFALALPPLLFPERFLLRPAHQKHLAAAARAAIVYSTPIGAFLLFVLLLVPQITGHFFAYQFHYLQTLLGFGEGAAGAKAVLEGPYGGFSLHSLTSNFATLFGISLVPWQLDPLIAQPGSGGVLSGQKLGLTQAAILLPIFAGLLYLVLHVAGSFKRRFRLLSVATVLYVVFESMLNGRHVPYITGYYYGSAFSVFFALLAGCCFGALRRSRLPRPVAVAAAAIIIMIQIDNFYPLNDSYIYIHNERMARSTHAKSVPLAPERTPTTAGELAAIRRAWRDGELASYLAASPVSAGAIFLVVELRWLDRLNGRTTR